MSIKINSLIKILETQGDKISTKIFLLFSISGTKLLKMINPGSLPTSTELILLYKTKGFYVL